MAQKVTKGTHGNPYRTLIAPLCAALTRAVRCVNVTDSTPTPDVRRRTRFPLGLCSTELFGESDEKPFRPADVAEPIRVFIPDNLAH